MKKIRITFGGSHRKNARDCRALQKFLVPGALIMPATMGTKRLSGTAYDSPELREVLKQIRGSVARHQPSYLNEVQS